MNWLNFLNNLSSIIEEKSLLKELKLFKTNGLRALEAYKLEANPQKLRDFLNDFVENNLQKLDKNSEKALLNIAECMIVLDYVENTKFNNELGVDKLRQATQAAKQRILTVAAKLVIRKEVECETRNVSHHFAQSAIIQRGIRADKRNSEKHFHIHQIIIESLTLTNQKEFLDLYLKEIDIEYAIKLYKDPASKIYSEESKQLYYNRLCALQPYAMFKYLADEKNNALTKAREAKLEGNQSGLEANQSIIADCKQKMLGLMEDKTCQEALLIREQKHLEEKMRGFILSDFPQPCSSGMKRIMLRLPQVVNNLEESQLDDYVADFSLDELSKLNPPVKVKIALIKRFLAQSNSNENENIEIANLVLSEDTIAYLCSHSSRPEIQELARRLLSKLNQVPELRKILCDINPEKSEKREKIENFIHRLVFVGIFSLSHDYDFAADTNEILDNYLIENSIIKHWSRDFAPFEESSSWAMAFAENIYHLANTDLNEILTPHAVHFIINNLVILNKIEQEKLDYFIQRSGKYQVLAPQTYLEAVNQLKAGGNEDYARKLMSGLPAYLAAINNFDETDALASLVERYYQYYPLFTDNKNQIDDPIEAALAKNSNKSDAKTSLRMKTIFADKIKLKIFLSTAQNYVIPGLIPKGALEGATFGAIFGAFSKLKNLWNPVRWFFAPASSLSLAESAFKGGALGVAVYSAWDWLKGLFSDDKVNHKILIGGLKDKSAGELIELLKSDISIRENLAKMLLKHGDKKLSLEELNCNREVKRIVQVVRDHYYHKNKGILRKVLGLIFEDLYSMFSWTICALGLISPSEIYLGPLSAKLAYRKLGFSAADKMQKVQNKPATLANTQISLAIRAAADLPAVPSEDLDIEASMPELLANQISGISDDNEEENSPLQAHSHFRQPYTAEASPSISFNLEPNAH